MPFLSACKSTFPWGGQYCNRSKNSWYGRLSEPNNLTYFVLWQHATLKISFGSQTQSSILQLFSKKTDLQPNKIRASQQIWANIEVLVEMKLVFYKAIIASKYCLTDQDLLKIVCSSKSHTSYSTSDWSWEMVEAVNVSGNSKRITQIFSKTQNPFLSHCIV